MLSLIEHGLEQTASLWPDIERAYKWIHQALRAQGVAIAERSVTNLLDRYDELLATALTDSGRLRALLAAQGRVILALDGLNRMSAMRCCG